MVLDLALAFYTIVIAIIFGVMYKREGLFFLWFLGTLLNAFAGIFFYFRHFDANFRIIGNIFYFLAAIMLGLSIFQEYHQLRLEKSINKSKLKKFSSHHAVFIAITFSLINIIQIIFFFYTTIIGLLLLKIYVEKKSITHLFMLLAIISGMFTLFFSILSNNEVYGTWETAYVLKIIYYSSLLATGLSAPMEIKLNKSELKYKEAYNRAEFYKDLFAHDISNILQNIQSSIDLLNVYIEQPSSLQEEKNLIDLSNEQIKRGANLVKNVRKLSEIEDAEIDIKTIEIISTLNDAIKYVKKNYDSRNINIKVAPSSEKLYVKANELLLNVFENILVNAIKYNNNPRVEIIIRISNMKMNGLNYLKIEFLDNGIGIPNEMKQKVFERAFMEEKSVNGMGLGLSLVKKIIDKFNGKIWVEDKIKGDYSKGTNFVILIPEVK
ncbi:MAG: HAMP domain-containing histidine kinase [Promethearchaeota archaeon]|nr:MAG: HAMP domain-containing histidine kinase [Candidatus Lokiarchaeota archaeon]